MHSYASVTYPYAPILQTPLNASLQHTFPRTTKKSEISQDRKVRVAIGTAQSARIQLDILPRGLGMGARTVMATATAVRPGAACRAAWEGARTVRAAAATGPGGRGGINWAGDTHK